MQPAPPATPETLDDDMLAFARRVFQYARSGATEALATLLAQRLPANLRHERGADPRVADAAGMPMREAAAKMGTVEAVALLNEGSGALKPAAPRPISARCARNPSPRAPTSGG